MQEPGGLPHLDRVRHMPERLIVTPLAVVNHEPVFRV